MNHIYWEAAQPANFINHAYDEKVIDALSEYFGIFPVIITKEHLPILKSWQRIGGGRPLGELIEAVESHSEIRVWWDGQHWRRVEERERRRLRPRASYQPREEVSYDNPYNSFTGLEDNEIAEDAAIRLRDPSFRFGYDK